MINECIPQKNALEDLFAQGKMCLTASKLLNINPKYRPFVALFADGTFLVNENIQTDNVIKEIVIGFGIAHPTSLQLKWQYTSPDFLKAVYRKAQIFDWYAPQYPIPQDLTADDVKKLRNFLKRITEPCLSVTTITTPEWFRFYSPDKEKFALFNSGWLVIAQNSPSIDELPSAIGQIYPQVNIIEIVPDYYISAIYEKLLYLQPSAREIYIELEKNKLQQKFGISEEEAMNKLQKSDNLWKKLLLCDEKTARSMIYSDYVKHCLNTNDIISI